MSTLQVTNILSNTTNTPPVIRDSNNTEIGTFCRAWVNFNASSGTPVIRSSFNVSSITDNGVGDFTINFTNAMPTAGYAVALAINDNKNTTLTTVNIYDAALGGTDPTTTAIRIAGQNSGTGSGDSEFFTCAIFC
jgi:hypothetical protein